MVEIREELQLALEADDRDRLDSLIGAGDTEDFATLEALVGDPEAPSTYRRRALYALGRWPGRQDDATAAIRAALPQLDEVERMGAVDALGWIGTDAARDAVLEHAVDPAPDVRRQVATALDRMAPDGEEHLRELANNDDVAHVREHAERLLERRRRAAG